MKGFLGLKRWQAIAGIGLLLLCTAATALTFGRVRGTPLMGRGLDISIVLVAEAQDGTFDANCFAAEVFYGEVRVSPNALSVSTERLASGEFRLRIRSSTAVDEPVVTLYARTQCGAPVARRYVLLAELLTETETQLPAVAAPLTSPSRTAKADTVSSVSTPQTPSASGSASGVTGAERSASPSLADGARRKAERDARRAARQAVDSARPTDTSQASQSASSKPAAKQSGMRKSKAEKSRLQVDLLDFSSLEPNLRSSFELSSEPTPDSAQRAQAQALWRAISASPEEILRDTGRLDTLEAQMRQGIERSNKQAQEIATLSTQLVAAERARYVNPFTIFLGLLTLTAVGLSVWLWRRGATQDRPWWRGAAAVDPGEEEKLWNHLEDEVMQDGDLGFEDSENPDNSSKARLAKAERALAGSDPQASNSAPLKRAPSRAPARASAAPAAPAPVGASNVPKRPIARFEHTQAPAPLSRASGRMPLLPDGNLGYSDFASSSFASSRLVSTEELFDIQEQADFFMSLDQPEQAIEVLKNHITDNVETSALAYMDLFDIYRRTGREADYEQLREEFNRVFNAQVPDFANYSEFSMGLEEYPQAMATIVQSWPKPQEAQGVIEEYIFRQPDPLQQPFDMLAYRELMLLYAMTKELVKSQSAENMLPTIAALRQAISGEVESDRGLDISLDMDEAAPLQAASSEEPAWLKELDQLAEPGAQAQPGASSEAENPVLPPLDFDLSSLSSPLTPRSEKN